VEVVEMVEVMGKLAEVVEQVGHYHSITTSSSTLLADCELRINVCRPKVYFDPQTEIILYTTLNSI